MKIAALLFSLLVAIAVSPLPAQEVVRSEKEKFKVEVLAEGLENPWSMVKLPDGRFLVTEKAGRLRIIENGHLLPEPVTGLPPIQRRGEGGLLDIELHPDYAKNGWIYMVGLKEGPKGWLTAIFRARLEGTALKDVQWIFEPPDEELSTRGLHFGSRIAFDDAGHVFFSIGDRTMNAMQGNPAQLLTSVRGKIHRLHDDGRVPGDNPFVHTPDARPSIWSYGHRNPQGLRRHPETGLLWETEHGPQGGDELNIIKGGTNYGWPLVTFGRNPDGSIITDKTEAPGMEPPITQWTPSVAICGIDFYTGKKFPGWKGNLFAATLSHATLIRMELDKDNHVTHQESLLSGTGRIRDVLCFDDGYVYVVYDGPGQVIRLVPAG